jgi:hypothetical protein
MAFRLLLVKSVSYVTGYNFCSPAALEKEHVYCAAQTGYLNVSYVILSLQRVRDGMDY